MKTLIAYYSNSGNNRYLAERTARTLNCDIETIRPRLGAFPLLILFSLLNTSPGIVRFKHNVAEYGNVILVGPIWMGQLISPLRDFLKRHGGSIKKLHFATCCGGGDDTKDTKFGYSTVFQKVKAMLGNALVQCRAFPVVLAVPEDRRRSSDAVMKTRLTDELFIGELQSRFEDFIQSVSSSN